MAPFYRLVSFLVCHFVPTCFLIILFSFKNGQKLFFCLFEQCPMDKRLWSTWFVDLPFISLPIKSFFLLSLYMFLNWRYQKTVHPVCTKPVLRINIFMSLNYQFATMYFGCNYPLSLFFCFLFPSFAILPT